MKDRLSSAPAIVAAIGTAALSGGLLTETKGYVALGLTLLLVAILSDLINIEHGDGEQ